MCNLFAVLSRWAYTAPGVSVSVYPHGSRNLTASLPYQTLEFATDCAREEEEGCFRILGVDAPTTKRPSQEFYHSIGEIIYNRAMVGIASYTAGRALPNGAGLGDASEICSAMFKTLQILVGGW